MPLSFEFSMASWFGSGNELVAMRRRLAMKIMSFSKSSAILLRGLDKILSVIGIARFKNLGGGGLGGAFLQLEASCGGGGGGFVGLLFISAVDN